MRRSAAQPNPERVIRAPDSGGEVLAPRRRVVRSGFPALAGPGDRRESEAHGRTGRSNAGNGGGTHQTRRWSKALKSVGSRAVATRKSQRACAQWPRGDATRSGNGKRAEAAVNATPPGGAVRQARLLARSILRGVQGAAGKRRLRGEGSSGPGPRGRRTKRGEPQDRQRGATNPQREVGESRRGGEKPRGRNESVRWHGRPMASSLRTARREWTTRAHVDGGVPRGGGAAELLDGRATARPPSGERARGRQTAPTPRRHTGFATRRAPALLAPTEAHRARCRREGRIPAPPQSSWRKLAKTARRGIRRSRSRVVRPG